MITTVISIITYDNILLTLTVRAATTDAACGLLCIVCARLDVWATCWAYHPKEPWQHTLSSSTTMITPATQHNHGTARHQLPRRDVCVIVHHMDVEWLTDGAYDSHSNVAMLTQQVIVEHLPRRCRLILQCIKAVQCAKALQAVHVHCVLDQLSCLPVQGCSHCPPLRACPHRHLSVFPILPHLCPHQWTVQMLIYASILHE